MAWMPRPWEANAALRQIVRHDTGAGYREMRQRMAEESKIATPRKFLAELRGWEKRCSWLGLLCGGPDYRGRASSIIDLNGGGHASRKDDARRHLIDMDADRDALGVVLSAGMTATVQIDK